MNPRDELPPQGKLPLPSPRSPDSLDTTVLAYARQNAPAKKRELQPAWMAGVATTCILLLALFISEPERGARDSGWQQSAQQMELKRGHPPALKEQPSGDSPPAVAAQARAKMSRVSASPGATARQDTAMPAAAEATGKLWDSAPQEEAAASVAASADLADQTAIVRAQLEKCALLLDSGDEQQAHQAYRELRQGCPDCDLPDSLEKAIKRYLKY